MDDGSPVPSREDELAAEAFRSVFPNGLPPRRPAAGSAIVGTYPLEPEHLAKLAQAAEEGRVLNVAPEARKNMSRRHHRLAQLLAAGMEPGRAGIICNVGAATVSILQTDPMFCELLDYYGSQTEEEWRDVVKAMADLHEDVVTELHQRLEDNPSQFTITSLTELMKSLSDRTGNGPTTNHKVAAVSVALDGNDLQRIKAGPAVPPEQRGADRQVRVLTEEDRRALEGVFTLSAADVSSEPSSAGIGPGEGDGLRAEGDQGTQEPLASDGGPLS